MDWNTVERAIQTEIDPRPDTKELASSVGVCQTATSPPREDEPVRTIGCNVSGEMVAFTVL